MSNSQVFNLNQARLEDYQVLLDKDKCLGKGAYGYVTLTKNK